MLHLVALIMTPSSNKEELAHTSNWSNSSIPWTFLPPSQYQAFVATGHLRFNGTMYNVVEPTLVAMATTFALGAESNRHRLCFHAFYFVASSH